MQENDFQRPRCSVYFKRSSTGKSENDGYEVFVAEGFNSDEIERVKLAAKDLRDWAVKTIVGPINDPWEASVNQLKSSAGLVSDEEQQRYYEEAIMEDAARDAGVPLYDLNKKIDAAEEKLRL